MREQLLFYSQRQIEGITAKQEQANWANGIFSLQDIFQIYGQQQGMFSQNSIEKSLDALATRKIAFFKDTLDRQEYYRIAYSYPENVVFLDIETTGLSRVYSHITLIGWVANERYKHVLFGNSLSELIEDLKCASAIVTFNGTLFDLKFLEAHYPELTLYLEGIPHIDLRFLLKRFGYTGGQKAIENQLNFKRPTMLDEVDGKEAISLWYRFLKGDDASLKKLLVYNYYDILGMIFLLNHVFFRCIYGKTFPKLGNPQQFKRKYLKKHVHLYPNELFTTKNAVSKQIAFFKHDHLKEAYSYTVAGIDLTGSEKKASGCAIIKANTVSTDLIFTDDDLIAYVIKNKVELVSIDSPLSLPEGRLTPYDDDPHRNEFGIMRYCERVLKKRGVNAYPALIPSMQKLTQRGIKLAKRFRELGIPVIESFPGAAQDVLQIPRKRTDLYFLKQGLIDFGLTGAFEIQDITHDELDGITSALVGQFFIAGYYEALGSYAENYMIIPDIKHKRKTTKKIYGICGPIATGKTELSQYIKSKGYTYTRYSKIIAEYLEEMNITPTRETLQHWGNKIFSEFGQYWLDVKLIESVSNATNIVIDGLRHPEDITFLKEYCFHGFTAVYIDTQLDILESRYQKLGHENYAHVATHRVEKNICELKKLADYTIENNESLELLYQKIDCIMEG